MGKCNFGKTEYFILEINRKRSVTTEKRITIDIKMGRNKVDL